MSLAPAVGPSTDPGRDERRAATLARLETLRAARRRAAGRGTRVGPVSPLHLRVVRGG